MFQQRAQSSPFSPVNSLFTFLEPEVCPLSFPSTKTSICFLFHHHSNTANFKQNIQRNNSIPLPSTYPLSTIIMVSYDYAIAKATMSDAEKDRILAIFLNTHDGVVRSSLPCTSHKHTTDLNPLQINWDKATSDYGSASADSMKVSLRATYKKIEKAGGKLADDGTATQAPATPKPATPATGSKKRKSKADLASAAAAGDDDEEVAVETPKPKRGRPTKKEKSAAKVEEDEVEEGEIVEGVKGENADDLV
jgi:hypothetical protein